jgi:hypothetical protein
MDSSALSASIPLSFQLFKIYSLWKAVDIALHVSTSVAQHQVFKIAVVGNDSASHLVLSVFSTQPVRAYVYENPIAMGRASR